MSSFVIDMGQCLRIPFLDDEEGRAQRRLTRNRPRAGKVRFCLALAISNTCSKVIIH